MYINKLRLKNFKCFKDTEIFLPKITVLTGANSSGKSSLLYGLLSAFQSHKFPFYLSPNGKYVNMGDYLEMSFNNSKTAKICIDISIGDSGEGNEFYHTEWIIDSKSKLPKLNIASFENPSFNTDITFNKNSNSYFLNFKHYPARYDLTKDLEIRKALGPLFEMMLSKEKNLTAKEKKKALKDIARPLQVKNIRNKKCSDLGKLVNEVSQIPFFPLVTSLRRFDNIDKKMNFIDSFRLQPARTYYLQARPEAKVEKYGENHIAQIFEWEKLGSYKLKELRKSLRDFGLLHTLKIRQLQGGRYEVRVKVTKNSVSSSLVDVGFGISQFLPVIVADLQIGEESTLAVAQPEIHLHPSVQASLADYFVKQIKQMKKRYFVETHSEYLLNRFRLAITKGDLDPADIAVYYFENYPSGTRTYSIKFTKDGKIKDAPKKFFDTYMMDIMDIALTAQ